MVLNNYLAITKSIPNAAHNDITPIGLIISFLIENDDFPRPSGISNYQ
jgi:hypothetical protein